MNPAEPFGQRVPSHQGSTRKPLARGAPEMEQFAESRFWKTIAVLIVLLLAVDVGHRLFSSNALPDFMPVAQARHGGIVNTPTSGIVTTNEDGSILYRWGNIEGTPGGLLVVKYDIKSLSIDRLDLK
jgi:hypothetical protein